MSAKKSAFPKSKKKVSFLSIKRLNALSMRKKKCKKMEQLKELRVKKIISGILLGYAAMGAVNAQTVPTLTCGSSLSSLNTGGGAWGVSAPQTSSAIAAGLSFSPAVVANALPPGNPSGFEWTPSPYADANYISVDPSGVTPFPAGGASTQYYVFQLQFTLPTGVDPASFSLGYQGLIDDDIVEVYVNNVAQGVTIIGFSSPAAPAATREQALPPLTSNWTTGLNTVQVVVRDYGGHSGILLRAGTSTPAPTVICNPQPPNPQPPVATVNPVPVNDWQGLLALFSVMSAGAWFVTQRNSLKKFKWFSQL